MQRLRYIILGLLAMLFVRCEDQISINLNDGDPRIVIEADITNHSNRQFVRISRTVSFSDTVPYDPVSGAQVLVTDDRGRQFEFLEGAPGEYTTDRLRGASGRAYILEVVVDGERYTAQSAMPAHVPIDSVSSSTNEFFGVSRKALHVHFQDPLDEPNYFRYRMAVNDSIYVNMGVFNDKFTNGRYVTHDLFNIDVELKHGDDIIIIRNQIDGSMYRYWYGIAMLNPAAAAPSNPPSNITGGALGYFSAHTTVVLRVNISDDSVD